MGIVSGIVVYVIVWWTVLFTVLPWGIRHPEKPEIGVVGAPLNPNLRKKFIITSLISAVIWLIIAYLMHIKIVDFRAISPSPLEG